MRYPREAQFANDVRRFMRTSHAPADRVHAYAMARRAGGPGRRERGSAVHAADLGVAGMAPRAGGGAGLGPRRDGRNRDHDRSWHAGAHHAADRAAHPAAPLAHEYPGGRRPPDVATIAPVLVAG